MQFITQHKRKYYVVIIKIRKRKKVKLFDTGGGVMIGIFCEANLPLSTQDRGLANFSGKIQREREE
jgi:hypothetical protein